LSFDGDRKRTQRERSVIEIERAMSELQMDGYAQLKNHGPSNCPCTSLIESRILLLNTESS